jgi:hypothetical protein
VTAVCTVQTTTAHVRLDTTRQKLRLVLGPLSIHVLWILTNSSRYSMRFGNRFSLVFSGATLGTKNPDGGEQTPYATCTVTRSVEEDEIGLGGRIQ